MRFIFLLIATWMSAAPLIAEAQSFDQAIHDAARLGNGDDVRRALAANPAARDLRTSLGSQPIHLAAMNSDLSAMRALIAAGANVNARDGEGATALLIAVRNGHSDIVRILQEARARK